MTAVLEIAYLLPEPNNRRIYRSWWVNFIKDTGNDNYLWKGADERLTREYNAKRLFDTTMYDKLWTIEFENSEDMTAFLVRWS